MSRICNIVFPFLLQLNCRSFSCSKNRDFNRYVKTLYKKYKLHQINAILANGEEHVNLRKEAPDCPIKEVFINQLAANSKVEDRWNIGFNQVHGEISSLLVGVVDGHSGHDCAQIVNKAALEYIAASYLNQDKLQHCLQDYKEIPNYAIVRNFHYGHWETLNNSVSKHFHKNLLMYINELLEDDDRIVDNIDAMKKALVKLDCDMCIPRNEDDLKCWFQSRPLLRLSLSGSVGLFLRLYWKGEDDLKMPTIHVGNVGDCGGILARFDKELGKIISIPLARQHNHENDAERERIINDHHDDSSTHLLRNNRLCGELACYRAFGDVRYKWPREWLESLYKNINIPGSMSICPNPYSNPPYLTAEPEVFQYTIDSETDKFLVLATDGLWDVLSGDQVVDIVVNCPSEVSPATKLLKAALCNDSLTNMKSGEQLVTEQELLSMHLALQPGVARYFRDDITVMVLRFV